MTYATPQALRMALEQRLLVQSRNTGIALDRLRRRVVFERVVARLQLAEPGRWVLKVGMALEVRLRDRARLTKDLDLGLRDSVPDAAKLRERLIEALLGDPDGDDFQLTVGPVRRLTGDDEGHVTWRTKVIAQLAARSFGMIQLDISPRVHELDQTDRMPLPNSLAFAGVETPEIEVVDIHRHAAEKFHGMLRDFGERENTRVRDLADLVILHEHEMIDPRKVATAVRQVWAERDSAPPPVALPAFPANWPDRYERLAATHDIHPASFSSAAEIVIALWAEMLAADER